MTGGRKERPSRPRVVATAAEAESLVAYADPSEGVLYVVRADALREAVSAGRWKGLELDLAAGVASLGGAALKVVSASTASIGPREPRQGATRFLSGRRRRTDEALVEPCAASRPSNDLGIQSQQSFWRRYEYFDEEGAESGSETWMNVMRTYGWPVPGCAGSSSIAGETYDTWVLVAGPFPGP